MTCKLYYTPNVPLMDISIDKLSDGEIDSYLYTIFHLDSRDQKEYYFSNYLVVNELRARIVEDKLKPDDFELYIWDGQDYQRKILNEYADSENWFPCENIHMRLLQRILRGQVNKWKLEKK